jgi:hypothetical protein
MEKILVELHSMLKTAVESIKKNPTHVMVVQKEKKRESMGCLLKAKIKERFLMSSQALSKNQKSNVVLLPMINASIAMPRGIGQETARNTWRI